MYIRKLCFELYFSNLFKYFHPHRTFVNFSEISHNFPPTLGSVAKRGIQIFLIGPRYATYEYGGPYNAPGVISGDVAANNEYFAPSFALLEMQGRIKDLKICPRVL